MVWRVCFAQLGVRGTWGQTGFPVLREIQSSQSWKPGLLGSCPSSEGELGLVGLVVRGIGSEFEGGRSGSQNFWVLRRGGNPALKQTNHPSPHPGLSLELTA